MKSNLGRITLLAATLTLLAATPVPGAWIEKGDAGPYYQGGAFQQTVGSGDLGTISGTTTIPDGIIPGETQMRELVDVFSIRVTEPNDFYATTDSAIDPRASASGDSRLFLIDPATGDVLLMNDDTADTADDQFKSLIAEPASYTALTGNSVHPTAQGVSLVAGNTYLLAVSEFAITPLDVTGARENFGEGFPLVADNAYASTDPLNTNRGIGGNKALVGAIRSATDDSDWGSELQSVGSVEEGIDYVVAIQGASFAVVPEPGTIAIALLILLGGSAVAMRHKLG